MKTKPYLLIVLLAIILVGCGGKTTGELIIEDAWARTGIAGGNSAVYFIIKNGMGEDDALLSASCDTAKMTQVHMSSMDAEGNMSMSEQERVEIPAGESVEFAQGGLHVMLMNLNQDLVNGDSLEVTLSFEKSGDVVLQVPVREP